VSGTNNSDTGATEVHPLFALLSKLESARIHFTVSRHRPDSILVSLTLVGERVEIDVFDDWHMEVSQFRGAEDIVGGAQLVDAIIRNNLN
jgi:hypothetical protein